MTLFGKSLIFTILLASFGFLVVAMTVFATHKEWRQQAIVNAKSAQDLKDSITRLKNEQAHADDRLAMEQSARRFALAALQSRTTSLEEQVATLQAQLSSATQANGILEESLATATLNEKRLLEETTKLRTDILAQIDDRNQKMNEVVKLTNDIAELQGVRAVLMETESQLRETLAKQVEVMNAFELTIHTPVFDKPPRVDGIITKVGETALVEISLGSDDGLRKHHTLEVFRNNSYLGRIRVTQVEPDRAVCEIIPEFRKGIIKRGDRVATKLS